MAASDGFTKAVQQAILDHFLTDGTWTPPATLYLGLLTAVGTGDAGTVTECTGTSYARVATTGADWSAAVAGADGSPSTKTNTATLAFPTAGGSWGTAVGWALFSASTAGTVHYVGTLTTSQAIGSGNTPSFAAGQLILQCGNPADAY